MKQLTGLFLMILTVIVSSCVKEGHVNYRFEVHNATEMPMTIHLSSWGGYNMYVNGMYDSKYKYHEIETINSHSSLIFSKEVGDDPDPYHIPTSLTLAWEYITAIDINGVTIPKAYFANRKNWELSVATQINGTFTSIRLIITPDLLDQLSPN